MIRRLLAVTLLVAACRPAPVREVIPRLPGDGTANVEAPPTDEPPRPAAKDPWSARTDLIAAPPPGKPWLHMTCSQDGHCDRGRGQPKPRIWPSRSHRSQHRRLLPRGVAVDWSGRNDSGAGSPSLRSQLSDDIKLPSAERPPIWGPRWAQRSVAAGCIVAMSVLGFTTTAAGAAPLQGGIPACLELPTMTASEDCPSIEVLLTGAADAESLTFKVENRSGEAWNGSPIGMELVADGLTASEPEGSVEGGPADSQWITRGGILVVRCTFPEPVQALPPDAQAAAQSLAQDLDGMPPEILKPAGPGAWQPEERDAGETIVATVAGKPDAIYDEWDYRRAAWRRDWCQLYETEGPAGEDAWVDEVRRRHAHLIRSIRRRFESLRGEDKPQKRQFDGEEIDLDAQVEARADRKSGAEPSPRLFIHRRRIERSLAVMFMVDMSGSTKGWVNDAERESLVLLCEAIEALGDSYAIYGFSGWTRTHCDIYRIKRFDDRYDAETRRRIAGIEARDYTRMGVAVRHLTGLLPRQNTRHKLLVTLSDGRPDDYGDEYRGRYGIEDTRRALLEAREKGIRSYCVTIDRHGADYLPQLYGPAHYSVIDDAKKLPRKIAEIYRKLTG